MSELKSSIVANRPVRAGSGSSRDRQKQATRARLLDAALALFTEQGFEATTVRQIAERAGVAVGSVFVHVPSEAELLLELARGLVERTALHLAKAFPVEGPFAQRLEAFLRTGDAYDLEDLRLVTVFHAYSWTWPEGTEASARHLLEPTGRLLHRLLEDGVASGELRPDLDRHAAALAIAAIYTRHLRRARHEASAVVAELRPQLALLLEGMRRRRSRPRPQGPAGCGRSGRGAQKWPGRITSTSEISAIPTWSARASITATIAGIHGPCGNPQPCRSCAAAMEVTIETEP